MFLHKEHDDISLSDFQYFDAFYFSPALCRSIILDLGSAQTAKRWAQRSFFDDVFVEPSIITQDPRSISNTLYILQRI
jgi:hypothetical protein